MSEIKYTDDGRKVAVIGQINSGQTVVQEIFVSGDNEFPSGENFVVSNLHDQPAEPWKEKRLRELEERYEKERDDLERKRKKLQNEERRAAEKAKLRAQALLDFDKNAKTEQLATLEKFLAGEISHVFIPDFQPRIVPFDSDQLYQKDLGHPSGLEGMKLVSLFGNSKGDLSYRINRYKDGSGDYESIIYPASSYEEALDIAQRTLEKHVGDWLRGERRGPSLDDWRKIEGVKIPEPAARQERRLQEEQRQERIRKLRVELEALEAEGGCR